MFRKHSEKSGTFSRSSAFAGIKKKLYTKRLRVRKNAKELVVDQNNQKGTPKREKFSQWRKEPAKPNLLSCLATTKTLKTTVPRSGTLWKHPRLLSSKVGRPGEIQ